ncbi:MAG: EamA family transporter [Actinomycetota bacterium]
MTGAHRTDLAAPALIIASLLWGTTGTAASFMPADVGPLAIGAVTMCAGGLLLFVFSASRALAALRDPASRRWLALGAIGVFVYPLTFYSAMNLAGVAIGNVVALGSGPVFAALLEWSFERRRPSLSWLLCTCAAVAGIGLLAAFGHADAGPAHPHILAGVALGLLAGFAYALYAYASSRALATRHGGRAVMGGMFGLGALLLLPVLVVTGEPLLQSGRTIGIAAYLVLGPMFLAYLLFAIGLARLRSSVATTITLIEPLVATVLAVVVVGERLTVEGWTGLALILVGVAAMATARLPGNPA